MKTTISIHEDNNKALELDDDGKGSIGLHIPLDGAELQYFTHNHIRMIAYMLLSLVDDE